jgi:hypothetical protein
MIFNKQIALHLMGKKWFSLILALFYSLFVTTGLVFGILSNILWIQTMSITFLFLSIFGYYKKTLIDLLVQNKRNEMEKEFIGDKE